MTIASLQSPSGQGRICVASVFFRGFDKITYMVGGPCQGPTIALAQQAKIIVMASKCKRDMHS